jgi:pyruvate kinase
MRTSGRQQLVQNLRLQIEALHSEMVGLEKESFPAELAPNHRAGARNLLHYVALRRHVIRALQKDLAKLGLSSLGRTESHVLGTIQAVLQLLTELSRDGGTAQRFNFRLDRGKRFPGAEHGGPSRSRAQRSQSAHHGHSPIGSRDRLRPRSQIEAHVEPGFVFPVVRAAVAKHHADLLIVGRGHLREPLSALRTDMSLLIRDSGCPCGRSDLSGGPAADIH